MFFHEKLQNFITEDGKLKQYPSKKPLRMLALAYLASRFEHGKRYTEKEVNEIIKQWHTFSDHELLRREMYTWHFMDRERDGSAYWLEKDPLSIISEVEV